MPQTCKDTHPHASLKKYRLKRNVFSTHFNIGKRTHTLLTGTEVTPGGDVAKTSNAEVFKLFGPPILYQNLFHKNIQAQGC